MQLSVGDTFFYQYPKKDFHLFFVVSSIPSMNSDQLVCTMLSSWKDGSPFNDPSCIIEAGEHPFVEHKSYVAYKETVIFRREQLENLIACGDCRIGNPVSEILLRRIRSSAWKSKKIASGLKQYFR